MCFFPQSDVNFHNRISFFFFLISKYIFKFRIFVYSPSRHSRPCQALTVGDGCCFLSVSSLKTQWRQSGDCSTFTLVIFFFFYKLPKTENYNNTFLEGDQDVNLIFLLKITSQNHLWFAETYFQKLLHCCTCMYVCTRICIKSHPIIYFVCSVVTHYV